MRKFFITLLGMLAFLPMTFAAYFANVPQVRVQPNGDTLRCFATGDEYFHRLHDADGYTIVLNPETGYYVYAEKAGDRLVPTSLVPGRANPAEAGLVPNLSISAEQWQHRRAQREMSTPEPPQLRSGSRDGQENHGHINNLVVFIRFSNDQPFTNQFNSVNRMFNDSTAGYNSMYNYFKAASYNQLAITSTFYPPQSGSTILSYQDSYPRGYFEPYSVSNPNGYDPDDDNDRTTREHQLLARAVNYIADMVPADLDIDYDNDNRVDNVVFVVRGDVGDWNDLLWPHRWSLYSEAAYIHGLRVWDFNLQLADATYYFSPAVLCHEMNHSLGAPDLYHYYEGTDMTSVYTWDLMHMNTNPPQHMGAYMKYKYGHWIDDIPEITECGTYTLHSLGSSATNNCYKIASPNPDEFFVLEYRNTSDYFEGTLPGSGLLVYRINSNFNGNAMWDGVNVFDEVYIYRPFGTPTNDGDVFSAAFSENSGRTEMNANTNPQPFLTDGTVVEVGDFTLRNISAAGGDSMTFKFCESQYLYTVPETALLDADSASTATVQVISDMSWTITGDCEWLEFSPAADSGAVDVQFTALSENPDFQSRSCQLTITSSNGDQVMVTVSQRGQEPFLDAEVTGPVSASVGLLYHANSTCNIEIHSNVAWTISSDADWIGLSQTEGEGGGSVTVTALTENYICVPRVSTITVTSSYGQSVALQVQQHNYYHGSLSVTPVTVDIENQMGATQVLTVNASDSWNVVSYPFWLNVSPVSGEFDDHNVTLTISTVNSSTSYRTGTVVISDICGRTDSQVEITVRQSYGYIEVADNSVSLGAEAGSAVNTTVSCSGSWNLAASTVPDWLSVSPASGSGVSTNVRLTALSDNTGEEPRTSVVRFRYTTNLSAELMVTQQAGTGILEVVEVSNVLYPNPVNDLLSVDMKEACRYTVYDVTGRVVISGELTSMQKTISFSGLESGAYFVRLCDVKTGKITAAKVIKR